MSLETILAAMDVPASKLDLSSPRNVNWLLRNLCIRNSEHPDFMTAVNQLKELAKMAVNKRIVIPDDMIKDEDNATVGAGAARYFKVDNVVDYEWVVLEPHAPNDANGFSWWNDKYLLPKVNVGDKVRVTLPDGYFCEAKVMTVDNCGPDAGWYLELKKDLATERGRMCNFQQSDYGYVKQVQDGAKIEILRACSGS